MRSLPQFHQMKPCKDKKLFDVLFKWARSKGIRNDDNLQPLLTRHVFNMNYLHENAHCALVQKIYSKC